MNFYRVRSLTIGGAKFPYASGFSPLPEMPFLESWPDARVKRKRDFWSICRPSPPGMIVEPGGRSWPDFIGNGDGPPYFFTSDRVLEDLRNEGIEILRSTRMPIAKVEGKAMRKLTPPGYHVVEAAPGITVDWAAMGVPTNEKDQMDTSGGLPSPWPPEEWFVDGSSWNGQDLMSFRNFQYWTTLVCSERVKQLAERNGWTNCRFDVIRVSQ